MNRQAVITLFAVMAYLIWLIIFLLFIEKLLRRLVSSLFGVTISRQFLTVTGPSRNISLLEWLFPFSWTVAEPATVSVKLAVAFMRFCLWLIALALPPLIGVAIYFWLARAV